MNPASRPHTAPDQPEPTHNPADRPEPTRAAGALTALIATAALLVAATPAERAAAQAEGRIDLVAQTAFVGDTPATIDLRLNAPAGARIRIRIFEALTSRQEIRDSYQGLDDQRPFSDFTCEVDEPLEPCQLNSTGEILSIEIPDSEIGEILRINQGALPVVITLRDSTGENLDTLITHLLVLDDHLDRTLHIAFLADLSAPPALQPDQTIQLDTLDLLERATRIARRSRIPITVALQPETLQALAAGEPDQLDEFIELLTDRPVLNAPWVDLDEEAWRLADDIDLVTDQYSHGAAVITEILGRRPTTTTRLDPNTTPETLALLRRNGTETAIIEADRIRRPSGTNKLAPLRLAATGGETMTAVAIDDSLRQTLNHPDPELAGQRALTELAVEAADSTTDTAILFDLDQLEPAALDVLLDGIDARGGLQASSVARALQVPVARDPQGRPLVVTLAPVPTADLSQRSADIAVTRGTVDAYASMIAPERAPTTRLETLMRVAAASQLSQQRSAAYTRSVFEEVLTGTAGITIEPAERITLTDRHADLRITVRNGQPLPITVEILLSAEKLRFTDGERFTRTLEVGDNEIPVRVETLAAGRARVTVNITSPGGRIELTEGVVDIRSRAISGLGLVISIIALVVLGGWWARTIRRVRRNRAADTTTADTTTATAPPTPDSTTADTPPTPDTANPAAADTTAADTPPTPDTAATAATVADRAATDGSPTEPDQPHQPDPEATPETDQPPQDRPNPDQPDPDQQDRPPQDQEEP